MSQDFQKYCRVCLDVTSDLQFILNNDTIQLELATCLSIIVTEKESLPKNICSQCVKTLHEYYNFHINARYSQDWLESNLKKQKQKSAEQSTPTKHAPFQPLLDCEYNSDSLLEFLNNTANAEDYITNLESSEIAFPSIVSLLEQPSENSLDVANKLMHSGVKVTKITSTKNNLKDSNPDDSYEIHMEIDVLDSDEDVVKEILMKESTAEFKAHSVQQKHRIQFDEVKETYSCMACKSIFNKFELLTAHMSLCESATRTCFECRLQFETRQKMQKHRLLHKSAFEMACEFCNKMFSSHDRLLQHTEKCHLDFVAEMGCVYKCKECGSTFQHRQELYKHAKDHLNENHYSCNNCGKTYSSELHLENHRKLKHKTVGESAYIYRCKVCLKIFLDRHQLYMHVKHHTASLDTEQHLCESCGKSFNSMAALNKHVLLHIGGKFKCKHCQKDFLDDSALTKHLAMHERDITMCELCGMTFMKFEYLQKHLKDHT